MHAKFRDTLLDNVESVMDSLHKLLTTEGTIVDISEVQPGLPETCSALMVRLNEYSIELRAREVD